MSKEETTGRFQDLELDDLVRLVMRHQHADQKAAALELLEFCEHTRSLVDDQVCHPVEQFSQDSEPAAEESDEENELLTWFHLVREGLSGRQVESDQVNRFVQAMEDYEVPHQFLFDFIRGVAQERAMREFRDRAELRTWACLVSSSMWLGVLKIFGVDVGDESIMESIVDLGVATMLIEKLTRTQSQFARKRYFLAQDEIIDRGLDFYNQVEPIDDELWKDLVQFQCRCIEDFLQSATRLGKTLTGPVRRRITLMVHEKWGVLKKIRRQPSRVLREEVSLGGFDSFKLKLRSIFGVKMPKIGNVAG